jgi:hypothetical protein
MRIIIFIFAAAVASTAGYSNDYTISTNLFYRFYAPLHCSNFSKTIWLYPKIPQKPAYKISVSF